MGHPCKKQVLRCAQDDNIINCDKLPMKKITLLFASFAILLAALTSQILHAQTPDTDWHLKLRQELPLLGHRNWIMIVDSAYPLQVSPGVETIETGEDLPRVLREVLAGLDHSVHVTPNVFLDAELPYVTDQAAPGASAYRQHLKEILLDRPVKYVPHETLIKQVNDAGQTFHILVLKTTMAIPYTSVFLQLDCKYWPPAAEQQLRRAMGEAK
jgi:hypothetical protein